MQSFNAETVDQMRGITPLLNNPPVVKEDYGEKRYLLIRDIWKKGTYIINDMQEMNNYASY